MSLLLVIKWVGDSFWVEAVAGRLVRGGGGGEIGILGRCAAGVRRCGVCGAYADDEERREY